MTHDEFEIPADATADLAAVMAARLQARARAAMADNTARAAAGKAGLRGAIEALSGLVSTFDPAWDVATRRMFYLAVNLQATALRDTAVELLTGLDGDTEGSGVAEV